MMMMIRMIIIDNDDGDYYYDDDYHDGCDAADYDDDDYDYDYGYDYDYDVDYDDINDNCSVVDDLMIMIDVSQHQMVLYHSQVRLVDCFLAEGPKVFYRTALFIIRLFYEYSLKFEKIGIVCFIPKICIYDKLPSKQH